MTNDRQNDDVQHGIDDNPHGDGKKALGLGAVLGGVVGALAGGPIGAVVGGTIGSLASGAAVDQVDKVDNDDTVSGLGDGVTTKDDLTSTGYNATGYNTNTAAANYDAANYENVTGTASAQSMAANAATNTPMNNTPGTQTGTQTGGQASGQTTGAGFDPSLHVGTYGTGAEQRNLTRSEYDALDENDRMKVQLLAEHLNVGKETRQAGEVTVSTHVVEEQVSVPVTLQREEVTITRHKVDAPVDAATLQGGNVFQDQTIKVPVHEEVATVTKEARVAEEIEIDKRAVAEQRTISDTVRREEIDINTPNNVRVNDPNTQR